MDTLFRRSRRKESEKPPHVGSYDAAPTIARLPSRTPTQIAFEMRRTPLATASIHSSDLRHHSQGLQFELDPAAGPHSLGRSRGFHPGERQAGRARRKSTGHSDFLSVRVWRARLERAARSRWPGRRERTRPVPGYRRIEDAPPGFEVRPAFAGHAGGGRTAMRSPSDSTQNG